MENKLVLASSSPRRRELLNNVGLRFTVIHPLEEEKYLNDENPEEFVIKNCVVKASSVRDKLNTYNYVLSADTVVVIDRTVLGKPASREEARNMLSLLSGKTHRVITGFIISDSNIATVHREAVTTAVSIRDLTRREIEGYIKTGEPFDKAGAYGIQGIGSFMVTGIDGSYSNVVGLPVEQVISALHKHNIVKLF